MICILSTQGTIMWIGRWKMKADSENGLIELIEDSSFGDSVLSLRLSYSLYLYSTPSTFYFLSHYVMSLFDHRHLMRVQQITAA